MLQARVKQDYRFGNSLQALARLEFVKNEWRDVPAHLEAEAQAHEWLETRERPVVEAGAIETVSPAPVAKGVKPSADELMEKMLKDTEPIEALDADERVAEEKPARRRRGG